MAYNDSRMPTWPGWETVRLLGRGSFGAVYEIERDVFGEKEKAALKVISIPQSDSDIRELYGEGYDDESITETFKEYLKKIVAEYSLMRKMNGSANVVNCDDVRYVQHDDGIGWDIFIKMELLTPLMEAVPIHASEEQVVRIGEDLCHALIQCRQFDIVHRDIKPHNIFVSPLGDYKLGDFGVAKTMEKTTGGTKIGTYKFMAPEVYNNKPYGAGADIYSLGLVLYWLLNERRMPFLPPPPEKLKTGMEEKARLRRFSGEAIPAPAHGSEDLKRIVLKACAYDPKDRYQSAEEMLRDLEALGTEAVSARSQAESMPEGEDENTLPGETAGALDMSGIKEEGDAEKTDEQERNVPKTLPADKGTEGGTVGAFAMKDELPPPPPPKPRKLPIILGIAAAILALLAAAYFLIHIWEPATCTEAEVCKICGKTRTEALGHDWGEWTVVTEPTCTEAGLEQRICRADESHIETREIPATGHTWKDATCTEPSVCTVCGAESEGPIGHKWGEPTYTWSEDNSEVTAKRTCENDPDHVETETGNTTSEVTTPASCTEKGKTTYTATFSNDAFSTQTKTVENVPATGHKWGSASYTWSEDNSEVTAKRICENDASHVETETASTTSEVTTPATCTEKGKTTYTAEFANSAFSTQTRTVEDIPATGHKWGSVSYTWSADNSEVTAKKACLNDAEHVETETVKTTSKVTTAATCTEKGKTAYTAEFTNSAFSAQTKTVADIPATGHSKETSFGEWSDWSDWFEKTGDRYESADLAAENGSTFLEESDTVDIEEKRLYRYRDITTVSEYSDWGNWSGWSAKEAYNSDTCEVATKPVYYYPAEGYVCKSCGLLVSSLFGCLIHIYRTHDREVQDLYDAMRGKGEEADRNAIIASYANYVSTTLVSESPDAYPSGQSPEGYSVGSPTAGVQYCYRTRTVEEKTQYSPWSEWTTEKPAASEDREVESGMMWHYRTRVPETKCVKCGEVFGNYSITPVSMHYYEEFYRDKTYVLDYTLRFAHDSLGRITTVSNYNADNELLDVVEQEYDADGDCTKQYSLATNLEELILETYDLSWEDGCLVKMTRSDGMYTVEYTNENGKPLIVKFYEYERFYMEDDYTYDELGRVSTRFRNNFGNWSHTYQYFYEGANEKPDRIQWSDIDYYVFEYEYDDVNRLVCEKEYFYFGNELDSVTTKTYEYPK